MLIGLNLSPIMDTIRNILIRFNFSKGVAQVAPNLIKSHKTRSTLTFAIFAVILTLNVLIATMVATQTNSTIGKSNEDSRGVDLSITLSTPENTTFSYSNLVKGLDNRITDVIPFRSCITCMSSNQPLSISTKDPTSKDWDPIKDSLPVQMIEVTKNQIIGNLTGTNDELLSQDWRYDSGTHAGTRFCTGPSGEQRRPGGAGCTRQFGGQHRHRDPVRRQWLRSAVRDRRSAPGHDPRGTPPARGAPRSGFF